MEMPNHM